MKRTAAIVAVVVAALGGSALAAGAPAGSGEAPGRADVRFEGVRLWVFQGSRLRAVGTADAVTYERAAGVARASHPEADFLGTRPELPPVHVVAGSAEGHVQGRTLDAFGGVTLRRLDGTATTRAAHFEGPTHLASGTEPVQVQTDRFRVQAQGGFSLDTESQQLELQGPVDATGEVQP